MPEKTVEQLAETLSVPVARLLQQMQEAGLSQNKPGEAVTDENQEILLAYLKRVHGESQESPKKITLKRRTLSTLKTTGSGRGRTVNVEVRKKRTYVRRNALEGEQETASETTPASQEVNRRADDEARRREAHLAAEAEAQKRREDADRAAQEALELAARGSKEEQAKKVASNSEAIKTVSEDDQEDTKISARKDKRDRNDLDEDDIQKKKSKQGNRKRRVEELLENEVEDLLNDNVSDLGNKEDSSTLGLTIGARPKRQQIKVESGQHKFTAPKEDIKREVEIGETITVQQLSQRMSVKATDVIKTLFDMDIVATMNQSIVQEAAILVVEEFGHTVKILDSDALENLLSDELIYEAESQPRSPVVTVMGHVDHGKTSLLDYIRKSSIADGEAGGITQHIGAYRVQTNHGEICFIDTPGHAAFTAMRARGAQCTDIVILVVAADDGVMPQTEEAIAHSKGAGVPIVVAINKVDLEGADPDRAKNELAAREVIPDDWGGDTQFIPVSALTGQGMDDLLEALLLQSEMLELTAVRSGPARGVVIESQLDKGRGSVATLLVQEGTLSQGDIVVAGEFFGRVRALNDEHGKKIKSVGPATPVEILGLDGTPAAGDSFIVAKDEKRAREVAAFRKNKANEERLSSPSISLDNLLESFGNDETKLLNIVVKADVRGSLEAIISSVTELGNAEVKVNVVLSGVGAISESDATYAVASEAVIFGFNVRADNPAKKIIEIEGLDLRYYKVIYDLVDDIKAALSGMLSPEIREEIVGIAEVRDVFQSKKYGDIAGCMVTEGTVSRNKMIRVLRDNVVIFEGELESLRRVKDEVKDVQSGTECGIGVKNYSDVKIGDQIEVFDTRQVAREL